ncbi:hypothetical protein GALMADRAFT_152904 [Galerina marginata CBS 339.88]|uniref:Uncharacterized protein n=1 Tax=Galerina marginata (strain CBS 339.88) TaxID=685588 RepID=A0A067TG54_GALM3|nr:hypothetical protein GALMADRAFT_152904 [Galerina marginata CBS 339.88]
MRYHTRSPLRTQSPNLPIDVSLQRSNPTCSLSLTSVSVFGKTAPDTTSSSDSMVVDSPPTVLVTISSSAKIPFPKRPHSLLRSTTSCVPSGGGPWSPTSTTHESDESDSPQDSDPPRKRTRTSALSTSTRTRSWRPVSTPIRVSSPSNGLIAPPPFAPPAGSLSVAILPTNERSDRPTFPSSTPSNSDPVDPQSQDLIHTPPGLQAPSSSDPLCIPSTPSPPQHFLRRAATTGMGTLLYLYRTLVYGLDVKYSDRPGKLEVNKESSGIVNDTVSCRVKAKSYFDLHDALLAQHLKMYLLASGVDIHLLVVNIEDVARESDQDATSESFDDYMKMDADDGSTVLPSQDNQFLHPHLHPTTIHSVLSYQQLVASHIMRHRFSSNRLRRCSSTLVKQRRKPSGLAECISFE